ncbi:MAG: hypothetical protein OJF59_001374 [Cytophagales bacterium]|jgi:ubiquinone/menaquinone biosynthesis C-methylase UbiE|nr:class I SAM-dependent methyltransferase [Bacteroidota bacterium]MBS1982283.1 class I SAM-dependent methyltransferase [Bacteroidota bacterium]WHZ07621.1 MAG: hypothetical protein OJF59_001374 [Cytophagales bacterium]
MEANDFDPVAKSYDRLARLVFGKSIMRAQKYFLNHTPDHANVLILGGGTGWLLKELLLIKPDVNVCYIEASLKMLSMAKEKVKGNRQVQFIHGTENDIPSSARFECVITNFYLDLFPDEIQEQVILKIKKTISPDAKWIAVDFVEQAWWHSVLLKLMYFFFRTTCNIESNKLPHWNEALQTSGAIKKESKLFYGKFIEATVYQ